MKLSVVIVNWRSKDFLRRCLKTLQATCAEHQPQIVVVDGASFDGCAEMLTAEFPAVDFVQSSTNVGFGRCNNLGFSRVTGEALLLLNPDTELRENAISTLLCQLERLPSAGILGPRLFNSDGSVQTSCVQSLPTPLNQALNSEFLRRLFPRSSLWGISALSQNTPSQVEAVSGACMMLRSETFRVIGGFSPDYFMYGEDMDLCARVRRLGLRVYHVPEAEIVHHGGGSSAALFSKTSTVSMRVSIHHFIRSHQGSGAALAHRFLMAISSIVRLALLLPVWLTAKLSSPSPRIESFRKWTTVLRWSVGLERGMSY